ncbi:class I tRNA ligase family protein [Mycoplasmoides fastidiosum]|nr:class I tRNA ligase family protein [Mycoplasmoides fastidiosum]
MFAAPEADLVDPTTETNLLAQDLNKHFQKVVTYKLRDWIFSRQRYWGEPIPIVFDQHDQPHVDYNLPLILPDLDKVQPSKDGRSPLVHATAWLSLEKDGQKFTRETNTMPNWAGSCWYYVGYLLKNRTTGTYAAIDTPETYQLLKRWLPVDVYIGGQEHAVLHLLYARFWHRFLYDIGIFPTKEPFQKLFNQGMILGPDGSKMSKSKGNIVSTDEIAESHGADALRLYECFMGPVAHSMPWSESGLNAIRKWIDRVYGTFLQLDQFQRVNDDDLTMQKLEAQLIKNFESCVDRFSFNIGVSEMMVFINYLNDHKTYSLQALKTFVQILSFYAPFLGEELWQNFLHQPDSVYFATWPRFNPDVLVDEQVDLAVTVNGKFVNLVKVQRDAAEATVTPLVLADPKVAHRIQDQVVKKQVYVVNKIFNLIIEPKH